MKKSEAGQEALEAEQLKNAALEAALETLTAENADLAAKLEAKKGKSSVTSTAKAAELPTTTFTVDDEEYRVSVPSFRYKGETITATDVLKDTTLQTELVKGGFGVIEKIQK